VHKAQGTVGVFFTWLVEDEEAIRRFAEGPGRLPRTPTKLIPVMPAEGHPSDAQARKGKSFAQVCGTRR
jgi:hypothetical protein